jgi:hypothetical protein
MNVDMGREGKPCTFLSSQLGGDQRLTYAPVVLPSMKA